MAPYFSKNSWGGGDINSLNLLVSNGNIPQTLMKEVTNFAKKHFKNSKDRFSGYKAQHFLSAIAR